MDASNMALALSALPGYEQEAALAKASELGFSAVSFHGATGKRKASSTVKPGFFWDDLSETEHAALKAARKDFDRAVIHAPFTDVPIISTNPYIEREAQRQVLMSVRAAGALELEIVTVHAVDPGNIPMDEFMERFVSIMRMLGDEAERNGTRIGLENTRYPTDPDEHVGLLDAIDHPAVGATLDIGHIAFWLVRDGISSLEGAEGAALYNSRLHEMIDRLGERIIHLHVHDVRPDNLQDHRAVGRGIIDFDALIERLNGLNFNGILEFELNEPDIERAIADSRQHLLAAIQRMPVVEQA